MDSEQGSLILDSQTVNSKYLLLHTKGDQHSGNLWRIKSKGPKVYSKKKMLKLGYPDPTQDNYLVIEIEPVQEPELQNLNWNFKKLRNYQAKKRSSFPFTTTLAELMRNKL
jgi:hypothetical protein